MEQFLRFTAMPKTEMFLVGLFCLFNLSNPKIIHTKSGDVSGKKINVLGKGLYEYLGIPYAMPPTGNLRFKPPQSITRWDRIYDATLMPPSCMQPGCPDICSEDCLYLNIWVPENANNHTVMVYFYGGAFLFGSISMSVYNGSVMSAVGDVILATVNYRVGAFGFLCSDTDDARGNMGMKDQVMGLAWVKDNIEYFGGDPSSITIFGESAGSISVSTHLVSPLTKGMMKAAIMQSGTAYNSYLIVRNITLVKGRSQKLADALGCTFPSKDISDPEVMSCMRNKDGNLIVIIDTAVMGEMAFDQLVNPWQALFTPLHGDDYLPNSPVEDFAKGNLHVNEIMIGNDLDEGSRFLPIANPFFQISDQIVIPTKLKAEDYIERMYCCLDNVDAEEVANFYLSNAPLINVPPKMVYDSIGDGVFQCPDIFLAESSSANGKTVFYYMYTYVPSVDPYKRWMRATHEIEDPFVFGVPLVDVRYLPEERKFSEEVIGCWTSFAKTGNPNNGKYQNAWFPYSSSNRTAVVLNPSNVSNMDPCKESCRKLWTKYI